MEGEQVSEEVKKEEGKGDEEDKQEVDKGIEHPKKNDSAMLENIRKMVQKGLLQSS